MRLALPGFSWPKNFHVLRVEAEAKDDNDFGADETTTVSSSKGGGNRGEHSSVRANDSKRVGGSSRTQDLFSHLRLVTILLGFFGIALGVFAILARSTGRTYGDFIEKPDAVPAIFGPYEIVASIVIIALGILVFRQRVIAAVGLLAFIVATDVLEYLVPMLNLDGVGSYTASDMALEAITLILTAIVVIADRAARSTTA